MDLITGNLDINVLAATGEILGAPQVIIKELRLKMVQAVKKETVYAKQKYVLGELGPYALPPQVAGVADHRTPRSLLDR